MFPQEKVLQEILFLLTLSGGRLPLPILMSELYLADCESIKERDSSLSNDNYSSLQSGPILSFTLNMLDRVSETEWGTVIEKKGNTIFLRENVAPSFDLLSAKERGYLQIVFERLSNLSVEELTAYLKNLPEWKIARKVGKKISFSDLMRALGKDEKEILDAKKEHAFFSALTHERSPSKTPA